MSCVSCGIPDVELPGIGAELWLCPIGSGASKRLDGR